MGRMGTYSLTEINQLSHADFTAVLGAIFEDTPDIASEAWQQRPFQSCSALHQIMCQIVKNRDRSAQLRLLQAHPDLGSRVTMAAASVQEQTTVGLQSLSQSDYHRFQRLNQAYRQRFGFPFIVAVRNHSHQDSIWQTFETRSQGSLPEEFETALAEVMHIAWYRLCDLIGDSPPTSSA